jgi:hypothetical protein
MLGCELDFFAKGMTHRFTAATPLKLLKLETA